MVNDVQHSEPAQDIICILGLDCQRFMKKKLFPTGGQDEA